MCVDSGRGWDVIAPGTWSGVPAGGPASPPCSATGSQAWVSRFNNPDHLYAQDQATDLAVSPDGAQVIVTGRSQDVDDVYGYATVAYDASDGQGAWARRYAVPGAPSGYNFGAAALAISPDSSRVFVTGTSQDSSGDLDYATIAYATAAGGDLWLKRYDGPANDFDIANALALSADGSSVFVTGQSWGTDYDYATVAYSAADGAPRWSKRYNGVAGGYDNAQALIVSPDGTTVFVTGESWRNAATGNSDYATLAYSTGRRPVLAEALQRAVRAGLRTSAGRKPERRETLRGRQECGKRRKRRRAQRLRLHHDRLQGQLTTRFAIAPATHTGKKLRHHVGTITRNWRVEPPQGSHPGINGLLSRSLALGLRSETLAAHSVTPMSLAAMSFEVHPPRRMRCARVRGDDSS